MKPFNRLVKQIRKWRFNQIKRSDSKIDRQVIAACEQVIGLPNISPEYVLRMKVYKTLSEEALKTDNITHYCNIRGLQAGIISLLKEELNNYDYNLTTDDNRPRPGVA